MSNTKLIEEISRLNKHITRLDRRHSLTYSFFRGIVTGLGTVLGATIVVAILAYLFSHVEFIPLIGTWLSEIIKQIDLTALTDSK